jgi:hypothetical protein
MLTEPYKSRLLTRIGTPDRNDCWPWLGTIGGKPGNWYGQYWDGTRRPMAHRVVYEEFVGPIPEGMQLDHLCRNTTCVNPAHLEPVTPRENQRRGIGFIAENIAKTHCHKGHELIPENTYAAPGKTERICRACRTVNNLATYYRNRDHILAARYARRRAGKKN